MRARVLAPALLALLAVPAAASAKVIAYGSPLKANATITEAQPTDTAFWPFAGPKGRVIRAPKNGQILAIRLRGTAVPTVGADPVSEIHFQHLRPQPGGAMTVIQTSQPFNVPVGGLPNQITTYQPENLCVRRGDVIAFNDEGGFDASFYPAGVPFRVFGRVKGSRTARFTGDTSNGATLSGATVRRNDELLMQLKLGAGPDQGVPCKNFNATG